MSRALVLRYLATLLALGVAGCGDTPAEPVEESDYPTLAEVYLTAALDIMQANSVNRYVVDWATLRTGAQSRIVGATTTAGTYSAIEWALDELGDNHSFFRRPGSLSAAPPLLAISAASNPEPSTSYLGDGIAFVKVPWFSGGGSESVDMAALYHTRIEAVDTLGVCGWVVDIRGNTGGNMWPMIAGVGPILGEGTAGYFIDPDTVTDEWGYREGASYLRGTDLVTVPSPYHLLQANPPVAVLTDGQTASSGEATTIAFRERPDTRSFGSGTRGVSTANRAYVLSDGATIYLTVSTMADRTKRLYGGVVEPDQTVGSEGPSTPTMDVVLNTAFAWLLEQPQCQGEG